MIFKKKSFVNDLIFNELIKRGYSMEGKTRVWNLADSKLWYLTPQQSQAFLNLENSSEYKRDIIDKEMFLIKENLREIASHLGKKPLNIIDLGCGDGKKAVLFIDYFKDKFKLRYCPIDISSYMVEKALDRIEKRGVKNVIKFQWNISDFENLKNISSLLRSGEYKKHFMLLLGNTLGNFEINELLYKIRSSMKEGDWVLIGNGLNNKNREEILRSYNIKEQHNFLVQIIEQLGLSKKDVKYEVRFINSRIEAFYVLKKDKEIKFQNKKIVFKKGDQIIVAVSYKYDENNFKTFLNMYFDVPIFAVSKDGSYVLALCKK